MEIDKLSTAVVGAGYVGLTTAVGLAEQGRNVLLIERNPDRLAVLAQGRVPFHEPELPEAYAKQHAEGRIVPSAELPDGGLDLIFVCVGTPMDDTGHADISQVADALEQPIPAIAAGAVIVIRSTLPSFDRWVELDLSYIDRWNLWLDFRILFRTMPGVIMARGR